MINKKDIVILQGKKSTVISYTTEKYNTEERKPHIL